VAARPVVVGRLGERHSRGVRGRLDDRGPGSEDRGDTPCFPLTPRPDPILASAEEADQVEAIDREAFLRTLESLDIRIADRTLTEADLRSLLVWMLAGRWPRPGCGATAELDRDAVERAKMTAAVAIRELHGGRFVDGGFAWVSVDGINLKAVLP
jgi:hypothetical protein